jgi:hypothetical protein
LTLCIRAHNGSTVMAIDERYVPLLHQVNLLAVANIVCCGMPVFNATAITMMVDRWRSKSHSFHLSCGEMMVTLEDVAMILGLPIRGRLVTNRVDSAMWHERVASFLGCEPPAKVPGMKGQEARVHMSWMCEEFQECPQDADYATVTLYVRAYTWHMFATVLFLDSTGDTTS